MNFLLLFFSCSICFQFCLSLRGNKNILVSLGRVQDLFLSLRLSFFVPWENFCPSGRPILSFSGSLKLRFSFTGKTQNGPALRTKNLPRDKKSSTFGTKTNLVPSLGIPKCFCFLSKTNKIENKLSS